MTKTVRRLLAMVPALLVATVLATPSASADDERVRMWEDNTYTGDLWVDYVPGQAPNDQVDIDWWDGDNEISSVKNETGRWLILWDNDDYSGARRCIAPGASIAKLSQIGFDNKAESFQLTDSTLC